MVTINYWMLLSLKTTPRRDFKVVFVHGCRPTTRCCMMDYLPHTSLNYLQIDFSNISKWKQTSTGFLEGISEIYQFNITSCLPLSIAGHQRLSCKHHYLWPTQLPTKSKAVLSTDAGLSCDSQVVIIAWGNSSLNLVVNEIPESAEVYLGWFHGPPFAQS